MSRRSGVPGEIAFRFWQCLDAQRGRQALLLTGALPELVKLLSDPDPKVRATAAWGSFYWLRDTVYVATAVPALEALLNDENETVRQRAERVLDAIRSKRA